MSVPSSPDSPSRATVPSAPDDPELVRNLRAHGIGRKVFGRFRLVRELGAGGMAVVWLAQDERLDLQVALKFLPGMIVSDQEALVDLRREITRGLRLTSPGIVRLYDLHEDASEGLAAIAMEYVEGSTLADEKARQKGRHFEVAEPLTAWTRTLCEVLTYLHEEARVVHRDLKPRNLMVTTARKLKVADFGIAATLCDSHSRRTQKPGVSGTPVYMSPQQALGRDPTVADDIYAVGATLYELITSKPPFHRGNVGVILNQVAHEKPPPMQGRRDAFGLVRGVPIPTAWEMTVAACLAKEPEERPRSASEVAERLGLGPTVSVFTRRVIPPAPLNIPPPRPQSPSRSVSVQRNPPPPPDEEATIVLPARRKFNARTVRLFALGAFLVLVTGGFLLASRTSPQRARAGASSIPWPKPAAHVSDATPMANVHLAEVLKTPPHPAAVRPAAEAAHEESRAGSTLTEVETEERAPPLSQGAAPPGPPLEALALSPRLTKPAEPNSGSMVSNKEIDWTVVKYDGRDYVTFSDLGSFYGLPVQREGNSLTLTLGTRSLRSEAGSAEFYINNLRFYFFFPAVDIKGELCLSRMDLVKIVEPVLRPSKIKPRYPVKTVILDPDGEGSGRLSVAARRYAADISSRALALLQAEGVSAVLTPSGAQPASISTRLQAVSRSADALLIGVRIDTVRKEPGVKTTVLSPRGTAPTGVKWSKSDMDDCKGNQWDAQSMALATAVHAAGVVRMKTFDLGVRHARPDLLRNATVPAIIFEAASLGSPQDAALIESEDFRQQAAGALFMAVQNFRRAVGVATKAPPDTGSPPSQR